MVVVDITDRTKPVTRGTLSVPILAFRDHATEIGGPGDDLSSGIERKFAMLAEQGAPEPRTLDGSQLEVAVLDRTRTVARKFRRLAGDRLTELLAEPS